MDSVQLAAQCVALAFHKSKTNIVMAIANCDYAERAIHGQVVERLVAVDRGKRQLQQLLLKQLFESLCRQADKAAAFVCSFVVIVLALVRFNVVQHLHGTLVRPRQQKQNNINSILSSDGFMSYDLPARTLAFACI